MLTPGYYYNDDMELMLTPGYYYNVNTRLLFKFKNSSMVETINHTNQSSSIMKLGCVPYEKCLYVITLRDSVWSGTDWVR